MAQSDAPQQPEPQPLIVYVVCEKCGFRQACATPLELNIATKSHIDKAHPAEAARLQALDAKAGKQLAAHKKTIDAMDAILTTLLKYEQGHIVSPHQGGSKLHHIQ